MGNKQGFPGVEEHVIEDEVNTVVRGSLVKNGLRIVNKNIVVNFACVVIPDVPQ